MATPGEGNAVSGQDATDPNPLGSSTNSEDESGDGERQQSIPANNAMADGNFNQWDYGNIVVVSGGVLPIWHNDDYSVETDRSHVQYIANSYVVQQDRLRHGHRPVGIKVMGD
jgi:hypothetical protein